MDRGAWWGRKEWDMTEHSILLFVTPWTVTHKAPLSMEFSRQEFLPPGKNLQVAIPFSREFFSPMNQTWVSCIAGRFITIWATREAQDHTIT